MALVLNEEQRLLRDTARDFLGKRAPVAALRHLRDTHDPIGYSPDLWREMAEMGWASIILPEAYGGLDFGWNVRCRRRGEGCGFLDGYFRIFRRWDSLGGRCSLHCLGRRDLGRRRRQPDLQWTPVRCG